MWTNPLQYGNSVTYSCDYVSQNPPGTIFMSRNETKTFTVCFKNTGTTTWYNNQSTHPNDYVTLKSVAPDGSLANSWLYRSGLGWIDAQTPCTMQESSVQCFDENPNNCTATFTFTGKVPANATIDPNTIYFRPHHSTGGLLSEWDGMNYYILVSTKFDFDGDCIADYWDRTSTGEFHLDYASDNLTGWDTTFYGYGGSNDQPAPADYDGDRKYDFAVLWNANRTYRIDLAANGFGGFDVTYNGYGGTGDYPCPCDYDGDRVDDISVRDADGDWHIDYASNGFGAWDVTYSNRGGIYDRPAPADYNGDRKCDFAVLRNSDRKYLIDYAHNGFGTWDKTDLGGYGGFADYPCPTDYDNDGQQDIAILWTSDRTWRVDEADNGFTGWDYILGGYGGTGDRPMPADYAGGGWDDVACYHASLDRVCIDYGSATQNYGAWDWCDGGAWHPTWKVTPETSIPQVFSLSQNYPNPFNPATTISYALPSASHVRIDIYNILGQNVTTLVDEMQEAGTHQVIWNAGDQPTGMYFYRIATNDNVETKKMLLIK
jgi:hypothetical protein